MGVRSGLWRRRLGYALAAGASAGACIALFNLQKIIDIKRNAMQSEEVHYLLPPEYLRAASIGYGFLAADFLWLRTIQHVSELKKFESPWLYNALVTVTSLDPRFREAYVYGGIWLSVAADMGQESNDLLSLGVDRFPGDWEIPFMMGFNYFFYFHDYKRAGDYISMAASLPNPFRFLPQLAARLYAQAGDPQIAVDFLRQMYENAPDRETKTRVGEKLSEAIVERDLQSLEGALARYKKVTGRPANALEALVAAGIIGEIPAEPYGGRYYLDERGAVKTTTPVERFRLYKIHRPERIEKKFPYPSGIR